MAFKIGWDATGVKTIPKEPWIDRCPQWQIGVLTGVLWLVSAGIMVGIFLASLHWLGAIWTTFGAAAVMGVLTWAILRGSEQMPTLELPDLEPEHPKGRMQRPKGKEL